MKDWFTAEPPGRIDDSRFALRCIIQSATAETARHCRSVVPVLNRQPKQQPFLNVRREVHQVHGVGGARRMSQPSQVGVVLDSAVADTLGSRRCQSLVKLQFRGIPCVLRLNLLFSECAIVESHFAHTAVEV